MNSSSTVLVIICDFFRAAARTCGAALSREIRGGRGRFAFKGKEGRTGPPLTSTRGHREKKKGGFFFLLGSSSAPDEL
jgi:hypothetical protein